jgi:sensor histidine kinase YesM
MQIDVELQNDKLIISNTIRERKSSPHSSRIGLKNLDERFKLITGKGISSEKKIDRFIVEFPLIPIST